MHKGFQEGITDFKGECLSMGKGKGKGKEQQALVRSHRKTRKNQRKRRNPLYKSALPDIYDILGPRLLLLSDLLVAILFKCIPPEPSVPASRLLEERNAIPVSFTVIDEKEEQKG